MSGHITGFRQAAWAFTLLLTALLPAAAWGQIPAVPSYSAGDDSATDIAPQIEPVSTLAQPPAFNRGPINYPSSDVQDAPGAADYYRDSEPVPRYIYEPGYFNLPGIGARQLPDYAPPGYEARDYQSAPGVPEFTPIAPAVPVSQADRDRYVVGGLFPGSFLAPGTNTSFRIRGFVRLQALGDFNPIGSRDSFVPNTIPVPQTNGRNFNMSARMSRLAVESWTPTDFCDWNVHTLIEGDFFNGTDQAAGGGGNPFRLRHAFFDFGFFRFGQQNSVFMDGTAWPSVVDFQGPAGWINQRQPSARVTLPITERTSWAMALERPFSDITTSGLGTAVQDSPDLTTHWRFEADRGHVQISGLLRSLGFRPTGTDDIERHYGAAISGAAVVHPWALLLGTDPVHETDPSGLTRSRIILQSTWGPGAARYVQDLVGQGLDGQVNPITGEFDLVNATAWNASYEHWFNAHWLSVISYSVAEVDNNLGQPGTTYERGDYMAVNLWWIPIPRMSFGIEYLRGERQNFNGQSAQVNRLNGLFQYNF
jgi:hypothetical protein